eukprot:CAMPEP_0177161750 /NCGR_PEP_ID=MMETSP0367-20130122/5532_1 /TAXON_ID=447022 ORGANISM="Scrippsiella hangoei-like, Strain SHHI-4" /NCGR_SAMPLE_ID=MMETSP0367 /ASSEMBLY_ACC=CAM_ASM_000362 /LENGTH=120 /DNA_ID=CAMNT_0018607503 /DNA_START=33 /DNA_END=392 /DNA_ORIENTATION=-
MRYPHEISLLHARQGVYSKESDPTDHKDQILPNVEITATVAPEKNGVSTEQLIDHHHQVCARSEGFGMSRTTPNNLVVDVGRQALSPLALLVGHEGSGAAAASARSAPQPCVKHDAGASH